MYLGFRVRNSGNADAPGTRVTVVFQLAGLAGNQTSTSHKQMTSIPAGVNKLHPVPFAVHPSCFDSATNTCQFSLTADSAGEVRESNENNNAVSGSCQRAAP